MTEKKLYCTNCGNEMDHNAEYCVSCGVSKGKIKKYCYNCGEKINEEQDFCVKCGTKLTNKIDLTKGKDMIEKVKKSTIESTSNLANAASEKTGKKIESKWLVIGSVGMIAILLFFFLMPKGLSGTYTQKTSFLGVETESSLRFKGKNYVEVDNEENTGTYEINENEIVLKPDNSNESITGTISKDKKSFKLMGMTYNKDE